MRRIKVCVLSMILVISHVRAGITYAYALGRFGDNLLSYLHAKWIAYRHDQVCYYRPFIYSDGLTLHDVEERLPNHYHFKSRISIKRNNYENIRFDSSSLYTVPYYSEFWYEPLYQFYKPGSPLIIDWKDKEFLKIVRSLVKPRVNLNLVVPPEDSQINVAVHIRRGGSYDPASGRKNDPHKFPPLSFYAEQLQMVYQRYHGKSIYVYIFTDDLNVSEVVYEVNRHIIGRKHRLHHRESGTSDTINVLDDFFSIPNFNVLIRPCSNFSYIAGKLVDLKLEIYPQNYEIIDNVICITEVEVIEHE